MNVPHDKICPDCGTYMNWFKDHYECPKCGHIGRKIFRWIKIGTILILIFGIIFLIS